MSLSVEAQPHWDGDASVACAELTVRAKGLADAKRLARLKRVMDDADLRDRLLELAERIEAERSEVVALAGC